MIAPGKGMQFKNMSASGMISDKPCRIAGIIVSSSSSLTLKAWDNSAASGAVVFDTTAAITAPTSLSCHNIGTSVGLYITFGGTGNICVAWHPE